MTSPQPRKSLVDMVRAYEHRPAADRQVWLDQKLLAVMNDRRSEADVLYLIEQGANINRRMRNGSSLLLHTLDYWPGYAPLLHSRGARYTNSEYMDVLGTHYYSGNIEAFLALAEPHPALERYVRTTARVPPVGATARLLRLGVPAEAFSPRAWAPFLVSEPGRWWQLRTGPPRHLAPVLSTDLARYVWHAL